MPNLTIHPNPFIVMHHLPHVPAAIRPCKDYPLVAKVNIIINLTEDLFKLYLPLIFNHILSVRMKFVIYNYIYIIIENTFFEPQVRWHV